MSKNDRLEIDITVAEDGSFSIDASPPTTPYEKVLVDTIVNEALKFAEEEGVDGLIVTRDAVPDPPKS